uniref:Uncharacterized protein n=1 Tax=Chromera velia CCMP2878 TaxID=1169474 RepID=A0A0G4HEN9_9ALVE|eukprot:Cvel_6575.t1-p1 / transcript=Cvel_6575.t1 / gene=Cvel_6575 / organism=Chromera_velia_CCMP2878 / gene_product=hypothetical protein / transcript_product=hypothetical protein / location=Cvel_scaffold324:44796-54990(+) / protein_length=2117 / sequence_SO=supercontig / SO=protein_coding / is_pseudo=false
MGRVLSDLKESFERLRQEANSGLEELRSRRGVLPARPSSPLATFGNLPPSGYPRLSGAALDQDRGLCDPIYPRQCDQQKEDDEALACLTEGLRLCRQGTLMAMRSRKRSPSPFHPHAGGEQIIKGIPDGSSPFHEERIANASELTGILGGTPYRVQSPSPKSAWNQNGGLHLPPEQKEHLQLPQRTPPSAFMQQATGETRPQEAVEGPSFDVSVRLPAYRLHARGDAPQEPASARRASERLHRTGQVGDEGPQLRVQVRSHGGGGQTFTTSPQMQSSIALNEGSPMGLHINHLDSPPQIRVQSLPREAPHSTAGHVLYRERETASPSRSHSPSPSPSPRFEGTRAFPERRDDRMHRTRCLSTHSPSPSPAFNITTTPTRTRPPLSVPKSRGVPCPMVPLLDADRANAALCVHTQPEPPPRPGSPARDSPDVGTGAPEGLRQKGGRSRVSPSPHGRRDYTPLSEQTRAGSIFGQTIATHAGSIFGGLPPPVADEGFLGFLATKGTFPLRISQESPVEAAARLQATSLLHSPAEQTAAVKKGSHAPQDASSPSGQTTTVPPVPHALEEDRSPAPFKTRTSLATTFTMSPAAFPKFSASGTQPQEVTSGVPEGALSRLGDAKAASQSLGQEGSKEAAETPVAGVDPQSVTPLAIGKEKAAFPSGVCEASAAAVLQEEILPGEEKKQNQKAEITAEADGAAAIALLQDLLLAASKGDPEEAALLPAKENDGTSKNEELHVDKNVKGSEVKETPEKKTQENPKAAEEEREAEVPQQQKSGSRRSSAASAAALVVAALRVARALENEDEVFSDSPPPAPTPPPVQSAPPQASQAPPEAQAEGTVQKEQPPIKEPDTGDRREKPTGPSPPAARRTLTPPEREKEKEGQHSFEAFGSRRSSVASAAVGVFQSMLSQIRRSSQPSQAWSSSSGSNSGPTGSSEAQRRSSLRGASKEDSPLPPMQTSTRPPQVPPIQMIPLDEERDFVQTGGADATDSLQEAPVSPHAAAVNAPAPPQDAVEAEESRRPSVASHARFQTMLSQVRRSSQASQAWTVSDDGTATKGQQQDPNPLPASFMPTTAVPPQETRDDEPSMLRAGEGAASRRTSVASGARFQAMLSQVRRSSQASQAWTVSEAGTAHPLPQEDDLQARLAATATTAEAAARPLPPAPTTPAEPQNTSEAEGSRRPSVASAARFQTMLSQVRRSSQASQAWTVSDIPTGPPEEARNTTTEALPQHLEELGRRTSPSGSDDDNVEVLHLQSHTQKTPEVRGVQQPLNTDNSETGRERPQTRETDPVRTGERQQTVPEGEAAGVGPAHEAAQSRRSSYAGSAIQLQSMLSQVRRSSQVPQAWTVSDRGDEPPRRTEAEPRGDPVEGVEEGTFPSAVPTGDTAALGESTLRDSTEEAHKQTAGPAEVPPLPHEAEREAAAEPASSAAGPASPLPSGHTPAPAPPQNANEAEGGSRRPSVASAARFQTMLSQVRRSSQASQAWTVSEAPSPEHPKGPAPQVFGWEGKRDLNEQPEPPASSSAPPPVAPPTHDNSPPRSTGGGEEEPERDLPSQVEPSVPADSRLGEGRDGSPPERQSVDAQGADHQSPWSSSVSDGSSAILHSALATVSRAMSAATEALEIRRSPRSDSSQESSKGKERQQESRDSAGSNSRGEVHQPLSRPTELEGEGKLNSQKSQPSALPEPSKDENPSAPVPATVQPFPQAVSPKRAPHSRDNIESSQAGERRGSNGSISSKLSAAAAAARIRRASRNSLEGQGVTDLSGGSGHAVPDRTELSELERSAKGAVAQILVNAQTNVEAGGGQKSAVEMGGGQTSGQVSIAADGGAATISSEAVERKAAQGPEHHPEPRQEAESRPGPSESPASKQSHEEEEEENSVWKRSPLVRGPSKSSFVNSNGGSLNDIGGVLAAARSASWSSGSHRRGSGASAGAPPGPSHGVPLPGLAPDTAASPSEAMQRAAHEAVEGIAIAAQARVSEMAEKEPENLSGPASSSSAVQGVTRGENEGVAAESKTGDASPSKALDRRSLSFAPQREEEQKEDKEEGHEEEGGSPASRNFYGFRDQSRYSVAFTDRTVAAVPVVPLDMRASFSQSRMTSEAGSRSFFDLPTGEAAESNWNPF